MTRILRVSKQILLWTVVLVSVFLLALSVAPRLFGYAVCCVHDDSMRPAFPQGTFVLGEPIPFECIRTDDVLIFEDAQTGYTFIRRVSDVWTDKQQLVTQGDACFAPDPMTTAYRCVVARATYSIPYLGYPSVWLHTALGKGILALLYIIWFSVEIEAFRVSKRREKSA